MAKYLSPVIRNHKITAHFAGETASHTSFNKISKSADNIFETLSIYLFVNHHFYIKFQLIQEKKQKRTYNNMRLTTRIRIHCPYLELYYMCN